MTRQRTIVGQIDIHIVLAFAFGIAMVITLLTFAVLIPNPSTFSQWIFIVVLALAAAGVGSVIPGMLHVELPLAKAGGALAIFAIVFWQKPAIVEAVARVEAPATSPSPLVDQFLSYSDAGDWRRLWDMLDPEAKGVVIQSFDQLRRVYAASRTPLGTVLSRREMGSGGIESPPGYPIGLYQHLSFRTKFSYGHCHMEVVTVRATDALQWRVFDHFISPQTIPCLPGDDPNRRS